ncbi:MAG: 1-acyl-sn-glycerol-3-phosphate acyltransferase [Propionibacteriales bacterium]|nr:1-acyl-sn-glycerol-3-phosphate acyltransferase [Propionibacteriales bacterium]
MPKPKRGWAITLCVAVLKPLLTVFTRRDWRDVDKIPATGGCVLVVNHVSHVDPMTYAHFVYDAGRIPRYLAKAAVFEVPVVGRVIASGGQIPVYRQSRDASHAFSAAVEAVGRGEAVIVHPEGTITRDPDLWPMVGKTGAARIALATGCPVVPTAHWGPQEILWPYTKKPRLLPRKTVHVLAGDPVDLDDLRDKPLTPEVLHEATDRIMAAITALLERIRGASAPDVRFDPKAHDTPEIGNPNRRRRARKKGSR